MWISKDKWNEMEKRIAYLESQMFIDVDTPHKEIDGSDWCYTFWKRTTTKVSLHKMVTLILNHLGVVPWNGSEVKNADWYVELIPHEQWEDKMKDTEYDCITRNADAELRKAEIIANYMR